MSRIKRSSLLAAVALALCAGLSSCKDDDLASDDHYKVPDWLKGNAYEVLQQDGNYSIFLRAIDLSDYQGIVAGKSILTVVAPTDDAFRQFLAQKGYGSIDELNSADHAYLNKLVGYHLMYYAFGWDKLVNFRPLEGDGITPEQAKVMAGYYYKHRTHSIDAIEDVNVKMTPNASTTEDIKLYHNELYLPVLSNMLFETKGIDPAYNYEYFFPGTRWGGAGPANATFNVANARVLDPAAVITDNGYLYHVDHVVEPLKTIYDELKENPDYSKFLDIYDRYSTYELADEEVRTNLGYDVYIHSHGSLPPIAWEWPNQSWKNVSILEMAGYNIFAPSNDAIDRFFSEFWTPQSGYSTIDDLDPLILEYFVMQSFSDERMVVFPEEIKNGKVLTPFGTPINIDPDQVDYRRLCANGALYGMDNMKMPAIFSSVVGPAFQDTRFRTHLYALNSSSGVLALASKATDFVTLIPDNQQYLNAENPIRLYTTNTGTEVQQYSTDAGDFVRMSNGALKNISDIHVAQNVASLPTTGSAVIPTNATYNYWFVKDGQITVNSVFNRQLEPSFNGTVFSSLTPLANNGGAWDNGSAYSYSAEALYEKVSGDGLQRKLETCEDQNYPYYLFAQLLRKADLITLVNKVYTANSMLCPGGDDRFFFFCPTNDVIKSRLGEIPGCTKLTVDASGKLGGTITTANKALLSAYLMKYFASTMLNTNIVDYPYVGSECKGSFLTADAVSTMQIAEQEGTLKISVTDGITPGGVELAPEYGGFPFAFADGCLHFINGLL